MQTAYETFDFDYNNIKQKIDGDWKKIAYYIFLEYRYLPSEFLNQFTHVGAEDLIKNCQECDLEKDMNQRIDDFFLDEVQYHKKRNLLLNICS